MAMVAAAGMIIFMALAALAAADQELVLGLDFTDSASPGAWNCLHGYDFVSVFKRGYSPYNGGTADASVVSDITQAGRYWMTIEVYISPNATSSKTGIQQVEETLTMLKNNGVTVRALWLQVTSPLDWPADQAANYQFISDALQRMRVRGVQPGIYTSLYDWQQITGNAVGLDNVKLWYWNVLGAGEGGETPANFNDFRGFGSFSQPVAKQYGRNEAICDLTVNRDVFDLYHVDAMVVASWRVRKAMKKAGYEPLDTKEAPKKLVVGYIGGIKN